MFERDGLPSSATNQAAKRQRVPSEHRLFSLVLALVASPVGMEKAQLLSCVYGYAGRADTDTASLERQFERDKDQLRALGIPIETIDPPLTTGDNKLIRYRISKERLQRPQEIQFTAAELSLLRLAALAWRDGSLGNHSRWSEMKVTSLGAGLDVQHLGITLRLGIPEPAATPLQRAIHELRNVHFDYQHPDYDAPLRRHVAPLHLHRADGRWHLIAYDCDRKAHRVFLLSRIASRVTLTKHQFEPDLLAEVPEQLRQLTQRISEQRAQLLVSRGGTAAARLEARARASELPRQEVMAQPSGAEDPHLWDVGTLDWHAFAAELASYGDEVYVLHPPELRDAVEQILRKIREQHLGGVTHA